MRFLRSTERLGNTTDDQRLLKYLLRDYKNRRLVRPVKDRSKAVVIGFSAELIGVAKVVRKELKSSKIFKWLRLWATSQVAMFSINFKS